MKALFGYAIVHSGAICYLTFWSLSWDIMEPVTYLVNLFTFITGVWFFNVTNTDFTFDALRETLQSLKREKLYKKLNFDIDAYIALRNEIYKCEQDLHNPEWYMLNKLGANYI